MNKLTKFIKKTAPQGVVLGMSGGIDSALVAALCVKALGKRKVFALLLPEKKNQDARHAIAYCKKLGIKYKLIPISSITKQFDKTLKPTKRIPKGNIRARVRMIILYDYSYSMKRLVAGTGNKSELMTGYFTKYGDGGVDFLPIGGLYKTQVFKLARLMGVPKEIIAKKPSAGLWPGQTDEKELGITYKKLDDILKKGKTQWKVLKLKKNSAHKRALPPIGPLIS